MRLINFKKIALIYRDELVSYEQLISRVIQYAHILDIKPGDRVVIFSENRPEWIYAFFAIWQRRGIAVPVDHLMEAEELVYILKDAAPRAFFVSQKNKDKAKKALESSGLSAAILCFETLSGRERMIDEAPRSSFEKDEIATILYTSGTTGLPKGVALSFGNLDSNIQSIEKARIANHEDNILALLPFHHTYPLMVTVLLPLSLGATVVIAESVKGDEIRGLMKAHGITIMVGVPRLFELLHNAVFDRINSSILGIFFLKICQITHSPVLSRFLFKGIKTRFGGKLKYFVSGGAKLSEEIARDFQVVGLPVIEGYGLTETSPICTFNRPDNIVPGSVGIPIPEVKLKIQDGELLISGPNVMKGYWNKDEKTSKVMEGGWFHTGDAGHLDEDGRLFITGRKKELIVLPTGKNINPEEVEAEITKSSPFVKEAAVMEKNGRLFALVFPDFHALKAKKITNIYDKIRWDAIDRYNRIVPDFRKVSGFSLVSQEFPRTRLGKIKRYLLAEQIFRPAQERQHPEEPLTTEYEVLKNYLKKVTKTEVFFDSHIEIDLGLDSLDKVELLNFLEQSFGLSISEEELAGLLVVGEIYKYIEDQRIKAEAVSLSWQELLKEEYTLPITKRPYLLILLKCLLYPIFKLYFPLKIQGKEKTTLKQPIIFAPNHQSYLDGFLLVASFPLKSLKDTYFMATEEFFRSPLRQAVAREAHIVTLNLNRNLRESIKRAAFLLKDGKNIVIFPEGARTRDGSLLPFKKAFAILSKEMNVPVLPVVLNGAFEAYPIGRKIPRPGRISLTFLDEIMPKGKDYNEISSEVREKIENYLQME